MENTNKKMQIVFGDLTLGLHGEDFHYIFSYQRGGLESLVINGMEWLYRVPMPTFWRALTDNDRGSQFHLKSGMWLSADMFIKCVGGEVVVDGEKIGKKAAVDRQSAGGEEIMGDGSGIEIPIAPMNNQFTAEEYAENVKLTFVLETITVPATNIIVSYEIDKSGRIAVSVRYNGKQGLPELPVFGMRFIMPTKAVGFKYNGLSGETYPDRMAGGEKGIYETEGLPVTPYLVPQDCGMHMQTEWMEVSRNTCLDNRIRCGENSIHTLRFEAQEGTFAFSCLPYTAEELENATHHEELPPARRTVVCIYGAVRGVGGIDSWGADVEEKYHISGERDIQFSFSITGQ